MNSWHLSPSSDWKDFLQSSHLTTISHLSFWLDSSHPVPCQRISLEQSTLSTSHKRIDCWVDSSFGRRIKVQRVTSGSWKPNLVDKPQLKLLTTAISFHVRTNANDVPKSEKSYEAPYTTIALQALYNTSFCSCESTDSNSFIALVFSSHGATGRDCSAKSSSVTSGRGHSSASWKHSTLVIDMTLFLCILLHRSSSSPIFYRLFFSIEWTVLFVDLRITSTSATS